RRAADPLGLARIDLDCRDLRPGRLGEPGRHRTIAGPHVQDARDLRLVGRGQNATQHRFAAKIDESLPAVLAAIDRKLPHGGDGVVVKLTVAAQDLRSRATGRRHLRRGHWLASFSELNDTWLWRKCHRPPMSWRISVSPVFVRERTPFDSLSMKARKRAHAICPSADT